MIPEALIFREEIDPNFPDLIELGANCSLVMVNSNGLYDLPRPTLEKVVNIGGVGAQLKDAKPLPEDLEQFVQKGEGAIVFSFGSVAPIHKAPDSWKETILKAFAGLPQYQFVMRLVDKVATVCLQDLSHLSRFQVHGRGSKRPTAVEPPHYEMASPVGSSPTPTSQSVHQSWRI